MSWGVTGAAGAAGAHPVAGGAAGTQGSSAETLAVCAGWVVVLSALWKVAPSFTITITATMASNALRRIFIVS